MKPRRRVPVWNPTPHQKVVLSVIDRCARAHLYCVLRAYAALVAVRRQEVQRCTETALPFSIRVTFCTFTFHRRRVAFFDHGRLFPYCGPRLQCWHLAMIETS